MDDFDGKGFSEKEFDKPERAVMRQRAKQYDDRMRKLLPLTDVAAAVPTLVKIIATLAVFGAALGWASAQGWF